jgi:PhnB protein
MKEINAYLMFDGNCAEAMFYQKCLKADLQMKFYSEMPGGQTPPGLENRIMHAHLKKGNATLFGSDIMPSPDFKIGNNFTVSINCDSKQEADDIANALKEGGRVTMPNQEMFWGNYFGMLTDKFGVDWMFSFELAKGK